MLYGRDTLFSEDVKSSLHSKKLRQQAYMGVRLKERAYLFVIVWKKNLLGKKNLKANLDPSQD